MHYQKVANQSELIIEAERTEKQYWKDLWRYRKLFCFLRWRDILVRYKQRVIGIAWALLRSFLKMVAFAIVFNNLALRLEGLNDRATA